MSSVMMVEPTIVIAISAIVGTVASLSAMVAIRAVSFVVTVVRSVDWSRIWNR